MYLLKMTRIQKTTKQEMRLRLEQSYQNYKITVNSFLNCKRANENESHPYREKYANEAGRTVTQTRGIKKRKQMSFTVPLAAAVLCCTVYLVFCGV